MISFIGHTKQAELLARQVERRRVLSGYLFCGVKGLGKTRVAGWFSEALVCSRPVGGQACTTCVSCEAYEHSTHPDVISIASHQAIGLDEIRALRERLLLQPILAKRWVVMIEDAALCTIESWNALLKTLEEPRGATVFIFVTHRSDRIPATIRSRLATVSFAPLTLHELSASTTGEIAPEQLVVAAGRPAYLASLPNETSAPQSALDLIQACDKTSVRQEQISLIQSYCQRRRAELHACLVTPTDDRTPLAIASQIRQVTAAEEFLERHITPSLIARFLWF